MTDSLCHCDGDGSERGNLLGSDREIITLCQVIGSPPAPPKKSFLALHTDINFAIKYQENINNLETFILKLARVTISTNA